MTADTMVRAGRTGVSTAFGTFGELLQGVLPERDGDFLVTLPIARWAMASYQVDHGAGDVVVHPAHKVKARRLVRMITDSVGVHAGGLLTITSRIEEGKGLASSSADLVATARAVGNALGIEMPPRRIESYLRRVEPTDGVLYPGIVAYHHRRVRLRRPLGSLPVMAVVAIDEGGVVDTVEFNRIPKPFSAEERREYARLLDRVSDAVATGDLAVVGAVATRSAIMNQILRPKRTLSDMIDICRDAGGLGVVAAHSGTTLGVLLDTRDPSYPGRVATIAKNCSLLRGNVTVYRTLSFGLSGGNGR